MSPSTTAATAAPAPNPSSVHPKGATPAKPTSNVQSKYFPPSAQQKKVPRRSSKPIINWFQRKLAGSGKTKRADDSGKLSVGKGRGTSSGTARVSNRVTSSPVPSSAHGGRQQGRLDTFAAARRQTISLNGDDTPDISTISDEEESLNDSVARESTWSPNSAVEADEDASLRPLPPSSPPSPSPSRSSSSYLSHPRTFKSIAASTKPTTLLSIDLHGNGMAHIAQAPLTPASQGARPTHAQSSSTSTGNGTSITFSALPSSPQPSSRSSVATTPQISVITSVQAPLHTTHHPRNNPRPSSPPLDNASVLTLASSAYAIPGLRVGSGAPGWSSAPPSAIGGVGGGGGGDSVSQFGIVDVDGTSQDDEEQFDERDADASLRALRPRSTRRGSWESEASRWSARIQVTGTPSLVRERSLWTTNSIRTGAFSAENVDVYEQTDDATTAENENSAKESSTQAPESENGQSPSEDAEPASSEIATVDLKMPDSKKETVDAPSVEKQLSPHVVDESTVVDDGASEPPPSSKPEEGDKVADRASEVAEIVAEGTKRASSEELEHNS